MILLSIMGTTLPLLLGVGVASTLLGAGSAAGSLALARRAEDRELLEAGEEALGLTEGEISDLAPARGVEEKLGSSRWPSPHLLRILPPWLIPPNA